MYHDELCMSPMQKADFLVKFPMITLGDGGAVAAPGRI